jgi:hypothetical protein
MTDMRDADQHTTEKIWHHLFSMLYPARTGAKQQWAHPQQWQKTYKTFFL